MTDKRQRQRESRRIADADLLAVSQGAHLLSRTPEAGRAVRLVRDMALDDPYLLLLLETGLVVTYARVFTASEGYTPIPRDWVPARHRALHDYLLDRRDSYHAHTDRAETNVHRRNVSETEAWASVSYPEALTRDTLQGLAEIADALRNHLAVVLDANRQAES